MKLNDDIGVIRGDSSKLYFWTTERNDAHLRKFTTSTLLLEQRILQQYRMQQMRFISCSKNLDQYWQAVEIGAFTEAVNFYLY